MRTRVAVGLVCVTTAAVLAGMAIYTRDLVYAGLTLTTLAGMIPLLVEKPRGGCPKRSAHS